MPQLGQVFDIYNSDGSIIIGYSADSAIIDPGTMTITSKTLKFEVTLGSSDPERAGNCNVYINDNADNEGKELIASVPPEYGSIVQGEIPSKFLSISPLYFIFNSSVISDPVTNNASPKSSITIDIPSGSEVRYTTDGSTPTASSELATETIQVPIPSTVKAKAFVNDGSKKLNSKVATLQVLAPPAVGDALPDGSIIFYDRGSSYGTYQYDSNGYPVRSDGAEDDGTATSSNWRYLICDQADLDNGAKNWGPTRVNEDLTSKTSVGYGLPNTEAMITKYADDDTYWWKFIADKRTSFGYLWFMPSKDELNMIYENKSVITGQGGDAFQTDYFYWSSSEDNILFTWGQDFSNGQQNNLTKGATSYCRLIRRV